MRRRHAPQKDTTITTKSSTSPNNNNSFEFDANETDAEDVYHPSDEVESPAYGFRKLNNGRKRRTKITKHNNDQINRNLRKRPNKSMTQPSPPTFRQRKRRQNTIPKKPSRSPSQSNTPNTRQRARKYKRKEDSEEEGKIQIIHFLYSQTFFFSYNITRF